MICCIITKPTQTKHILKWTIEHMMFVRKANIETLTQKFISFIELKSMRLLFYYFTLYEFFISANADRLTLKSDWQ